MKVKRPDLSLLKKIFLVDLIKGLALTFSYQRPSLNYTEQYPKVRPKVAERFRGTNPTGFSRAWCAIFANMILTRTGYRGTGSAAARSFARYGRPASGPAPGVIAVWPHHVGFVVSSAGPGRIRVVSGNHNHRVEESTYATHGVMAFRYP